MKISSSQLAPLSRNSLFCAKKRARRSDPEIHLRCLLSSRTLTSQAEVVKRIFYCEREDRYAVTIVTIVSADLITVIKTVFFTRFQLLLFTCHRPVVNLHFRLYLPIHLIFFNETWYIVPICPHNYPYQFSAVIQR